MIDRITITVDEQGAWNISAGGVLFHRTTVVYEALLEVKGYLNKLAYFPTGTHLDIAPTPFEELPHQVSVRKHKESEKERLARKKAETHLDSIRQDKAPESPREPLPQHKVEPLARIRTGDPPTPQAEQPGVTASAGPPRHRTDKGTRTATGAPAQLILFNTTDEPAEADGGQDDSNA